LTNLEVFDFSFNEVHEMKEIERLREIKSLKEVSAEGNPIERERTMDVYRNEIKTLVP
jgi:hypothetical protein